MRNFEDKRTSRNYPYDRTCKKAPRTTDRSCAQGRPNTRRASARQGRWGRSGKAAAVVALVIVALAAIVPSWIDSITRLPQSLAVCAGAFTNADTSTPKSEWRKGEVPYLYQTDPQWAGVSYAGSTIEKSGCGPAALSMVYVCVTGKTDASPKKMAAFSERHGFVEAGATRWTFMSEGAARFGLRAKELSCSATDVTACLNEGQPVICIVGPGDFTTTGHFIVLCANKGAGKVEIRDPNSPANSHIDWSLEKILSQCRNLWAYSLEQS